MKEKYIPTQEESIKAASKISFEEDIMTQDRVNEKLKNLLGDIIEGVKIGEVGQEELISEIANHRAKKPVVNTLAFVGLKDELEKIFQIDLIDKDTLTAYQQIDDLFPNLSKEERIAQLKKTDSLLLHIADDLIHYELQIKQCLSGLRRLSNFEYNDLANISYYKPLFSADVHRIFRDINDNYVSKILERDKSGVPFLKKTEFTTEFVRKKDEMFRIAIKEIAEKSLAGWDHNKEKYSEYQK